MSEIIWNFYSDTLGRETSIRIYFPDAINECTPLDGLFNNEVTIALHGLGGNSRQISSFTPIEYLATKYKTIVILPEASRSFYLNNKENFQDFICSELIDKLVTNFNIPSPSSNKWNIIGISMGGYGAINIASKNHNIFKKSCGISSALDYEILLDGSKEESFKLPTDENWPWIESEDPLSLKLSNQVEYCLLCGTDDPFYRSNLGFKNYLENNSIKYTSFFEKGDHSWPYWNIAIQRSMRFIRGYDISLLDY